MTLLAAQSSQRAIALVILVATLLLWVLYMIIENRRTPAQMVDSFLNAPNRKSPPDDETFEGPRLDRFLGWALVALSLVALSLPLYWLGEPGRHEGAIRGFDKRAIKRGEELFGALHNGFNCAQCHGPKGGGGLAPYTVTDYNPDGTPVLDAKTGKVALRSVQWVAPRINDIALRYRPEQIRNILNYGRGGAKNNPMPAWGTVGGGPGTPQQIDNLVQVLKYWAIEEDEVARTAYNKAWASNGHDAVKAFEVAFVAAQKDKQVEHTKEFEESKAAAKKTVADSEKALADAQKLVDDAGDDPVKKAEATKSLTDVQTALTAAQNLLGKGTDGEILFNINCARCHTSGWSYGEPKEQAGGFYGPTLRAASLKRQFPDAASQEAFIAKGAADNQAYGTGGVNHWSGGGMPYFENILTPEQIKAIVEYERSLDGTAQTTTGVK